jgi:polysaccharide pyruvyl transferase WcaK-like protein
MPVFFAGVGVCEIRYPLTRWFLRTALAESRRVSLRDAGSIEILRRLGISRELILCPDLAFGLSLTGDDEKAAVAERSEALIGLSPIAFGSPGGWPTENAPLFNRYWNELTALAADLLRDGYPLLLFSSDDVDFRLTQKLYDQLTTITADKGRIQIAAPLSLCELLPVLGRLTAVVAGRLHGVLLSHISGVPALAISYHRKVRSHMNDMGQERFCLDFESFTATNARVALADLIARRAVILSELRRSCAARYLAVEREFATIGEQLIPQERKSLI